MSVCVSVSSETHVRSFPNFCACCLYTYCSISIWFIPEYIINCIGKDLQVFISLVKLLASIFLSLFIVFVLLYIFIFIHHNGRNNTAVQKKVNFFLPFWWIRMNNTLSSVFTGAICDDCPQARSLGTCSRRYNYRHKSVSGCIIDDTAVEWR